MRRLPSPPIMKMRSSRSFSWEPILAERTHCCRPTAPGQLALPVGTCFRNNPIITCAICDLVLWFDVNEPVSRPGRKSRPTSAKSHSPFIPE